MIGSPGSAQTMPVGIVAGSVEQAVSTLENRLETLGAHIQELEGSLHQVLRGHQLKDASASGGKPLPSTPLASRLEEIIGGVENLTSHIESIRGRVDI